MENKKWIPILIFIFFFVNLLLMYIINPTQAEVERYFEENKCYSEDYCVYNMRRSTAMLYGQIFEIPWFVTPKFILYTTTPFNYYHEVSHSSEEIHTYTWIDTRDGRFVYNAVNGKYVREIDDKEDPARKWIEDMDKHVDELRKEQVIQEPEMEIEEPEAIICSYNAYHCADFSTHAEAQAVFEYCGANTDIHHLDGDDDRNACETLP